MGVGPAAAGLCVQHHRSATGSGQGLGHLKILLFPLSEHGWPWSADGTKEPGLSCMLPLFPIRAPRESPLARTGQGCCFPCCQHEWCRHSWRGQCLHRGTPEHRQGRSSSSFSLALPSGSWGCSLLLGGAHILPHSRKCSCLQLSCLCQVFQALWSEPSLSSSFWDPS